MGPFTIGQIPSKNQFFNILESDGVSPRDLTAYTTINMIVTGPNNTSIPASAMGTTPAVTGAPTNQITLHWNMNTSPFVTAGAYRYQFQLSGPGNVVDYTGVGTFDVDAVSGSDDTTTNWCTLNDVLQITGRTVSQDQLDQAQFVIDMVTNRTVGDLTRIRARDLIWLKRGLAYQVAWQLGQPDLLSKTAFNGISQDGFSGQLFNKSGNYLGPLAEKCLKNLSWLRSRSIRVQNSFIDGDVDTMLNPLGDDEILMWEPL